MKRLRRVFASTHSREALKAIAWNFSGMFCSLVTGVLTARILAPDERGLLALAITISSLSYLFSSMGTNNAFRTFQPERNWANLRTYLFLSIFLLMVDVLIVLITVIVFISLGFAAFTNHLIVIAVLGLLTFLSNQLLDVFNAIGRSSQSAKANTAGHFFTMSFLVVVFLLSSDKQTLAYVLGAYAFGYLLRVGVMLTNIRRENISLGERSPDKGKKLLRHGIRFWGIGLGQTLTFRSDQLLLGILSNAYQVGIYAVSVAPASLMQVVSNSIGQVAYRQAATGSLTVRRYGFFVGSSFGITFLYALTMWFIAPWLIPFIFGADYVDAVPIVRALLVAELILSPYLISVRVLAGFNRPYISSMSGILGFIVLIIILLILIPMYSALGAAIGVIIAYGVMLSTVLLGIRSYYKGSLTNRAH